MLSPVLICIYIFLGDKMTPVSHYTAFSGGIIYQRDFSRLYGPALHALLNISVSSRSLNSSFDQFTPGTATDSGGYGEAAGCMITVETT